VVSKQILVQKRGIFGKKGQEGIWKELVIIIIILIVTGAIIYGMWQILPK